MYLGQLDPVSASALTSGVKGAFDVAIHFIESIGGAFGVGEGRKEADTITPVQNQIQTRLAQVDNMVGATPYGPTTTNISLLQNAYAELAQTGQAFKNFVSNTNVFKDGRASEQALNTIMPLIDGTGGYTWPDMQGQPVTEDIWGNPTDGGRMGSIQRRIQQLGGTVQPPILIQGPGVPQLTFPLPSQPYLPQAGILPPTSMPSQIQAGNILSAGGLSSMALPIAALAAIVFLSRGKRG